MISLVHLWSINSHHNMETNGSIKVEVGSFKIVQVLYYKESLWIKKTILKCHYFVCLFHLKNHPIIFHYIYFHY